MLLQIGILIISLTLVVFGADWLVDGASTIARKAGISEFVIGLTIVGFGTSCPELVVSLTGAFKGLSDISLGNVVGSNIFNTLLILGITAVIAPMVITPKNKKRDIPMILFVTVLLIVFGKYQDNITRLEGAIFLLLFIAYIWYSFKTNTTEGVGEAQEKTLKLWQAIALVILGLAALIGGGQFFVDSATKIATQLGVSDKFIAITLLAGGTSLPELATCIIAAIKKKGQLALGNIIGSNIFNILLILGSSAVIRPLDFSGLNLVDIGVLLVSAILLFTSCYTGKKNLLDRFDGTLMLLCEAGYLYFLFTTL